MASFPPKLQEEGEKPRPISIPLQNFIIASATLRSIRSHDHDLDKDLTSFSLKGIAIAIRICVPTAAYPTISRDDVRREALEEI